MVQFRYSDCGHPSGTVDGTPGDLLAKQLQMMVEHFCTDMKTALRTGMLGRSSHSMVDIHTHLLLEAVADDPSPANVAAACESFNSMVRWLCSD